MTDTEQTPGYMPSRRWEIRIFIVLVALLLSRAATGYAGLENPNNNGEYSGIGFISGWKCSANGALTAKINGGETIPLAYLNDRPDTQSVCGDTNNGFITIINWAEYGTGTHTVEVFDNGVNFGRHTFHVVTLGEAFVRGARDVRFILKNWPFDGDESRIAWNQATQHFEIVDYTDGDAGTPPPHPQICTTKTSTVYRFNNSATWTVTNPCGGETLDIDITPLTSEEFFVCSVDIVQGGVQFEEYSGFLWRDRNTQASICGDILPGITKRTRVTVEADSSLTFLQPFDIYYDGTRIFEFR